MLCKGDEVSWKGHEMLDMKAAAFESFTSSTLAKCFLVGYCSVRMYYVRDLHVWVKQKPVELLRHGYGTTLCFYMHVCHMLHHVQLKTALGTNAGICQCYCRVSYCMSHSEWGQPFVQLSCFSHDFQYAYQLSNTLST